MQQTRQFLDEARKLLGEKFIVISCEDSIKYKTSEKDGIKIMVSLQDDNSVVFLDLIQVKIRKSYYQRNKFKKFNFLFQTLSKKKSNILKRI